MLGRGDAARNRTGMISNITIIRAIVTQKYVNVGQIGGCVSPNLLQSRILQKELKKRSPCCSF